MHLIVLLSYEYSPPKQHDAAARNQERQAMDFKVESPARLKIDLQAPLVLFQHARADASRACCALMGNYGDTN